MGTGERVKGGPAATRGAAFRSTTPPTSLSGSTKAGTDDVVPHGYTGESSPAP